MRCHHQPWYREHTADPGASGELWSAPPVRLCRGNAGGGLFQQSGFSKGSPVVWDGEGAVCARHARAASVVRTTAQPRPMGTHSSKIAHDAGARALVCGIVPEGPLASGALLKSAGNY